MTTWRDIAVQQAHAARQLSDVGVVRPSISRAYYAAYSAVTYSLHRQGLRTFGARNNPDHADVPALVLHTLRSVDRATRRSLASSLRRLRMYREDADYRPARSVDAKSRLRALWEMDYALRTLGVNA